VHENGWTKGTGRFRSTLEEFIQLLIGTIGAKRLVVQEFFPFSFIDTIFFLNQGEIGDRGAFPYLGVEELGTVFGDAR
jgi:hypothetical protein